MIYKEISLLLNKIGIDLNKIKINKNDINNVNKSETYKSIAVNKENKEDFVNFSDISLDKDEGETNYNDENLIYNNEETLENVYFKLKTIYGDRKYNIKQEAILENNMKKVYKYIPISKVDVMVTNHSRNDKIKDKLRDAMPIIKYIYSKEFKDFDFSYDGDNKVLKNINFKINRGETVGIVGKTGCGKTTLIKQLLRLYPISEETLLLDGHSAEQYYDYSIREKMGYAPQEYQLFSKTIKENILFYRKNLEENFGEQK